MRRSVTRAMAFCLVFSLLTRPFLPSGATGAEPPPDAKCPVCGMFVAKYPEWVAQIHFKDRTIVFFDGAKDLFKYFFRIDAYHRGRSVEDIAAIYVTDYYTLSLIDARTAFFVVGSDVYGPMGKELVALEHQIGAGEFMKDHHGEKIIRFKTVSPALLQRLD